MESSGSHEDCAAVAADSIDPTSVGILSPGQFPCAINQPPPYTPHHSRALTLLPAGAVHRLSGVGDMDDLRSPPSFGVRLEVNLETGMVLPPKYCPGPPPSYSQLCLAEVMQTTTSDSVICSPGVLKPEDA